MSQFLVTGATGYVGRALCVHLVARGYKVLAMTRGIPALAEQLKGVAWLQSDYQSFEKLGEVGQIDGIIHLAARAHIVDNDPDESLRLFRAANLEPTVRLARKAIELNIPRFIFISTIGVNGNYNVNGEVFTEASTPAPHSPYAVAKYEAEQQLQQLMDNSCVALTILRLPLVYSGDAPGNFKKLLKLVSLGLPLPFGLAKNKRSILSLENLLTCIERCCWHEGASGQLFLLSDGKTVSTRDIISHIATGMNKSTWQYPVPKSLLMIAFKLIGKQSMYAQLFEDLEIDNSKFKASMQWQPTMDCQAALEKSGFFYKRNKTESN